MMKKFGGNEARVFGFEVCVVEKREKMERKKMKNEMEVKE